MAEAPVAEATSTPADGTDFIPYDPIEQFQDAAGDVRDPYPDLAEQRRTHPVYLVDWYEAMGLPADAEVPQGPPMYTVFSHQYVQQVLSDNETYSSTGLRGRDGPADGPHDPRDGRARAPAQARARGQGVPHPHARALERRVAEAHRRRAPRRGASRWEGRSGPRPHLPVPGAGDRTHPWFAARRLGEVPALVDRADQRRRQLGPCVRCVAGAEGLLRRHRRAEA